MPASQTYMSKRLQECNWLQAMEGGIDSSHVSILHSKLRPDPAAAATPHSGRVTPTRTVSARRKPS